MDHRAGERPALEAIAAFGFTERQARFLVNVLLHSGVFLERQYCSFAGIVHGQKSTDFIKKLVERRFAAPITTGELHRGRMFHVHYKPLWAAIGEPDNRFRKPTAQGRMIERVMLLDAVLDDATSRGSARPLTSVATLCAISATGSTAGTIRTCCLAMNPRRPSGTSRTSSQSVCSRTRSRMCSSTS
ncbi:MAG: hypothetical protein H0W08_09275 [Acidobacteria bacterium]|nr:hypothetical protein [Acidobacteriota bacterium]